MPDFDAIASSVRVEQKKSKERKIALNTAQWTTQEGRDAHYEQAPWSTVQGQSSADMGAAARAVGARGISEQKAENRRRKIELNGGKDAAASITSVGAQPRARGCGNPPLVVRHVVVVDQPTQHRNDALRRAPPQWLRRRAAHAARCGSVR